MTPTGERRAGIESGAFGYLYGRQVCAARHRATGAVRL
jgi:hypothetical protein